jgi:hypothetical protein
VSGIGTKFIVTELVVEQNTISSAGEQNAGGGYPSGSMTALMVFNATFHNISDISWCSCLLVEETGENHHNNYTKLST